MKRNDVSVEAVKSVHIPFQSVNPVSAVIMRVIRLTPVIRVLAVSLSFPLCPRDAVLPQISIACEPHSHRSRPGYPILLPSSQCSIGRGVSV